MNKLLYLSLIALTVILAGCSNDNEPKDTVKEIEITVSSETGIMYDLFDDQKAYPIECMLVKLPDAPNEWQTLAFGAIEGFTYEVGHEYLLKVKQTTLANPPADASNRRYELITILEDKVVEAPYISITENSFTVSADGETIAIQVKANRKPTSQALWSDNWLIVSDIKYIGDGNYEIPVHVEANNGLGRISSITIMVEGTDDVIVGIIQNPTQFGENMTVEYEKEGSLPILLGENKENLRRIRNLTIRGCLNGIDLSFLKSMMISNEDEAKQYPLSLDLSNSGIWAENKNPYEAFGWDASKYMMVETTVNEELPSNIFANSKNLISISLPTALKYIDYRSFWNCSSLKSINIPNSVEGIASEAFYLCTSLENINISKESNLMKLGSQVFATGTTLESLTIPECCIYINGQAFLGCKTKELHLNWTADPEQLTLVPDPDICTLYIPKGTLELYKSIPCWAKYKNIVEE